MTQTHPDSSQVPAARPSAIIRHDGWTPARQALFLNELAATHCVATAAKAAGMSRAAAYALRARLKGEPFDRAWQAALISRFDALAEVALDRALNGVEVPHYYKGELVGTSRRFDERLTVALLMMRGSFAPDAPFPTHPAARYRPDEFAALVERVAIGPETWDEERRQEYAAELADFADDDDDDYFAGEAE